RDHRGLGPRRRVPGDAAQGRGHAVGARGAAGSGGARGRGRPRAVSRSHPLREGAPAPAQAPPRAPTPAPGRALWINGRITSAPEAFLSLHDRGARDGEGLFETLRVYAGEPLDWERHMERLVLSAAELGFPVPPSPVGLRDALSELLEA